MEDLFRWLRARRRVFVLTGAGVSTGCGIPDYRDRDGRWKRRPPVQYGEFVRDAAVRRRYWARSMAGWPAFSSAAPGPAHRALARLQESGFVHELVTQNVDGLHQAAGSRNTLDLHGRLDTVVCLECGARTSRHALQDEMARANPAFAGTVGATAPDGDADLEGFDPDALHVPACRRCGGILKPAVVFFGESVPRAVVEEAFRRLDRADGLLVVGSSLMVYSGYRFCVRARGRGKPAAAVNLGRTRAEGDLEFRIRADCGEVLGEVAARAAR